MKILVCGGRDFTDWYHLRDTLDELIPYMCEKCIVISGGANGADTLAINWAKLNYLEYEVYKADWNKHGKAAGPIRNQQMLDEGRPDLVVAFPGGKGTAHMKKIAREAGVEVIEIEYKESE